METIGNKLIAWLQQMGLSQGLSRWILVLAALLLLVLLPLRCQYMRILQKKEKDYRVVIEQECNVLDMLVQNFKKLREVGSKKGCFSPFIMRK